MVALSSSEKHGKTSRIRLWLPCLTELQVSAVGGTGQPHAVNRIELVKPDDAKKVKMLLLQQRNRTSKVSEEELKALMDRVVGASKQRVRVCLWSRGQRRSTVNATPQIVVASHQAEVTFVCGVHHIFCLTNDHIHEDEVPLCNRVGRSLLGAKCVRAERD